MSAQSPLAEPIDPNTQKQATAHHRQGWQYLSGEAFDRARDEFQQAIRLVSTFPNAYYGLGKAHMGLRAYDKAIAAFATCRDQYSMAAGAGVTQQLAARQRRQDQVQELRSVLRELRSSSANQNRAAQGMPPSRQVRDLEEYLRQLEDAERSGRGALSADLSVPAEVHLSLGSAYFRTGKLREAEAAYVEAVKAKPDFGEAHNNLAVVYLETGRVTDAERSVTAAEKAGFRVHPQLKEDIKNRKRGS